MPTIKTIDSIKIMVYYDDHAPPHFHAAYNEFEELIEIETLETYAGELPTKQRKKMMSWAASNQVLLMNKWNEFNPNG